MAAMKKTLLQMVKDISSATDDEPITALDDTLAAEQMVQIVEEVFYDYVTHEQPEHKEFMKLTAASDSAFPTHFYFPDNSTDIEKVWYDRTEAVTGTGDYKEVFYLEPLVFIERLDGIDSAAANFVNVEDKNAGTNFRIQNDKWPQYWTSFDDYWIVMDSFQSAYDTTLQESKVRAYGRVYPTFDRNDPNYVLDIDEEYHQVILHEAISRYMDRYKGGTTSKQEQLSRRARYWVQNDKYRNRQKPKWIDYGRR